VKSRGQAALELAIIAPFVVGLLAVTLQGGLLLSDQVRLQHYAYDAGQWAQANLSTATTSNITTRIYDQLCGPGLTPATLGGSTPATRFCDSSLSLNVSTRSTPTSLLGPPGVDVLAASSPCVDQPWSLTVTPALATVDASTSGGTQHYTVTATSPPQASPAPSPPATPNPVITLYVRVKDAFISGGSPSFTPAQVSPSPGTSVTSDLSIKYTTRTRPATYDVYVTGEDQCGVSQPANPNRAQLKVNNNPLTVSPAPTPPVTEWVDAVTPTQPCTGVATTLKIFGGGFVPGVIVNVGGTAATVTYTVNNEVDAVVTIPTPGIDPVTVTYPDGVKATLVDAINATATCPPPSPAPPPGPNPCASAPGSNEMTISLAWKEPLVIPLLGSGIQLKASEYAFCQ
jgi:hypothetical protein